MGELGLTVAEDLELALALKEASRVKVASRANIAWEACARGREWLIRRTRARAA